MFRHIFRISATKSYLPKFHYTNSIRSFTLVKKVWLCPEPGEATKEIDILEWKIKNGDKVVELDLIGRAKYTKADYDLFAPYTGIVEKILIGQGQIAKCHEPLIEFLVEQTDQSSKESPQASSAGITSRSTGSTPQIKLPTSSVSSYTDQDDKILTIPAVRRIAKENNIDLSNIRGTGKDGRIMKEDVLNFMQSKSTSSSISSKPLKTTTTTTTITTIPIPKIMNQDYVENIIGVKRAMVQAMTEANKVPQFGYGDEICLDRLVYIRNTLKTMSEKYGVKISYMPFIIKAVSLALINAPSLNAYINETCTQLTWKQSHNIGVAVDSPSGLIVPNIKNVQNKTILEIAQDLDQIIQRARNNKINNDDITGGTFTLSNIGAIGGTYCRPIVFVPQVCIGALGAIQKLPRYNSQGNIISSSIMAVSWSADHRVIDGASVARFSNEWKNYLENPETMLLYLK